MADWSIFGDLKDILIQYFFGSHLTFSVATLAVFSVSFVAIGMPLRYVAALILPMAGGFAAAAWFGAEGWVLNLILIAVGLLYGYTIIRLTS